MICSVKGSHEKRKWHSTGCRHVLPVPCLFCPVALNGEHPPDTSLSFSRMETAEFASGRAGCVGKRPRDLDPCGLLQKQHRPRSSRCISEAWVSGMAQLPTAHVRPRGGRALGLVRTHLSPSGDKETSKINESEHFPQVSFLSRYGLEERSE